jgi:hypothetical protein
VASHSSIWDSWPIAFSGHQAAVWIANLIQYKREGFKPDRDIIVALTADEEGGGPYNGVDWLLKNHRDLIDAELALNEGGWGEESKGKKISNDLQVSEKYVLNFRFEVRNKGGHSSMPVRDNAIYRLAEALQRLADFGFPLKTNEVTAAYFQQMATIETGPIKDDLTNIASGSQEAMQRVAAASPAWNSTLRTTCVATMLEGGHAINALPQVAAATVNCRVLPEDSPEYVLNSLQKVVADEQVIVQQLSDFGKAVASPLRPDVLKVVVTSPPACGPASLPFPSWLWALPTAATSAPPAFPHMASRASSWTAMTFASTAETNAWASSLSMKARPFSTNWSSAYRAPTNKAKRFSPKQITWCDVDAQSGCVRFLLALPLRLGP